MWGRGGGGVYIIVVSAEEDRSPKQLQIHIIYPTPQLQILQLPEYEFHIMIFVDILQLHISDIGTSK